MAKISVIGAGSVGATIANDLMIQGTANEIVLVDINKKKAEGEALCHGRRDHALSAAAAPGFHAKTAGKGEGSAALRLHPAGGGCAADEGAVGLFQPQYYAGGDRCVSGADRGDGYAAAFGLFGVQHRHRGGAGLL